jgi:hypothetical protein
MAASIVGPRTTGVLIDALLALRATLLPGRPYAREASERFQKLMDRLASCRANSLVAAILARHDATPADMALMGDLLARQDGPDAANVPLHLKPELREQLIERLRLWAAALLGSRESTRHQFCEVARAIGRVAASELLTDLRSMLDEDLRRWREARAAFRLGQGQRGMVPPDVHMSYVPQYRQAFVAISTDAVIDLMPSYLEDQDFGIEAALALKLIWERRQGTPIEKLMANPDFREVADRQRARRSTATTLPTSPPAEAIFAAAARLLGRENDGAAHALALGIAAIGTSLPYGNKAPLIEELLNLPLSWRAKLRFVMGLILAGERVGAYAVTSALAEYLEEAKQKRWMLDQQNLWAIEAWLELLPFTDRPSAALQAIESVQTAIPRLPAMAGIIRAFGSAPGQEAEQTLGELSRRFPDLAREHDWTTAFLTRGTVSAVGMLLDRLSDPTWPGPLRAYSEAWSIGRELGSLARRDEPVRAALLDRYRKDTGAAREVIERALSETGSEDCVLALVQEYARRGRAFDGILASAIREAALSRQPVAGWGSAFEWQPVALTELRRRLCAMLRGKEAEAALARACLIAIDNLRDEYGTAEFEPRHPDIASGQAWPIIW